MASVDYSLPTVFTDNECECSSDSGLSVGSYSTDVEVDPPANADHFVYDNVLLPVVTVELIPIGWIAPLSWPVAIESSEASLVAASKTPSVRCLIKWSLPPPIQPVTPLPGWTPMPYGLEVFWQSAFAWFFNPFLISDGHCWTLQPTELPPLSVEWPWHSSVYLTKVRFQCQCKRGWTSMKGRIVFWYRMRRQGDQILCEVLFKLFGQQCSYCTEKSGLSSGEIGFLTPLWYPEEIENAISFLSKQVIQSYYGGRRENQVKVSTSHRVRRHLKGISMFFHDVDRCQACLSGFCSF